MAAPAAVRSFLVAGTAPGAGKTVVTVALLHALRQRGVHAIAMKPMTKDASCRHGAWHSPEMARLAAASAFGLPERELCAHWIRPPAGPATGAARHRRVRSALDGVVDTFRVLSTWADAVLVEESSDAEIDDDDHLDGGAVAGALQLPFILVARIDDGGCVESARTRTASLKAHGLECAGWIANHVDAPANDASGVADALAGAIAAPCLGIVPHLAGEAPADAARAIKVDRLMLALGAQGARRCAGI